MMQANLSMPHLYKKKFFFPSFNMYPRFDFFCVFLLQEERFEHITTKAKLTGETEKLQFALGEIDILNKQLQREKAAFEAA